MENSNRIDRFKKGLSTWKEIKTIALTILIGVMLFLINLGLNELIDKKWYSNLMFDFGTVCILAVIIATIALIYELSAKFYVFLIQSSKDESKINNDFINPNMKQLQKIGYILLIILVMVVLVFTIFGIIEIFKNI